MRRVSLHHVLRFVKLALVAFVLASLCQNHVLTSYRISGNSMLPFFQDGDRVVVAILPDVISTPEGGDAVIAKVHGETLIKRVAGAPGDTVEIRRGHLVRNGDIVSEGIPERFLRGAVDMEPISLSEDEYFLLGDHRRVSIDSRDFGPVHRSDILGKVVMRFASSAPATASIAKH